MLPFRRAGKILIFKLITKRKRGNEREIKITARAAAPAATERYKAVRAARVLPKTKNDYKRKKDEWRAASARPAVACIYNIVSTRSTR